MQIDVSMEFIIDSMNAMNRELSKGMGQEPPPNIPHGAEWRLHPRDRFFRIEWEEEDINLTRERKFYETQYINEYGCEKCKGKPATHKTKHGFFVCGGCALKTTAKKMDGVDGEKSNGVVIKSRHYPIRYVVSLLNRERNAKVPSINVPPMVIDADCSIVKRKRCGIGKYLKFEWTEKEREDDE